MSTLIRRSPMLLSLLTLSLLAACSSRSSRGGGGGDDDDTSSDDDDDTTPVGDDDDQADDDSTPVGDDDSQSDDDSTPVGDDDTATLSIDGLSFAVTFTASGGPTTTIDGTFLLQYYQDIQNNVLECTQRMAFTGEVTSGVGAAPGCDYCEAHFEVDESSVQDVSNPAVEPDDCDSAALDAAQMNFGPILVLPTSDTAYGDFSHLGIMTADGMAAVGYAMDGDPSGDYTADALATGLDDVGMVFDGIGLVENIVGTLADASGLDAVAAPESSGSDWYGYWYFFHDPSVNTWNGEGWNGDYLGQAVWILTFGP